jgi:2-octaprenyl-6-methoxyphenol hydroxylase
MHYDVAIVGGGIVGLSAALAAGQAGANVILIDRGPPPRDRAKADGRTAALLDPAIAFLDRLGVWHELAEHAAPLKALRIVNLKDQRAANADLTFRADEVSLDAFGHNIPNDALSRTLHAKACALDGVTLITSTIVSSINVADDHAVLTLDDGRHVAARLLVAADGRHSAARQALGIDAQIRNYGQSAIVCSFGHERPHEATSIELHRPGGPFTMVPLPGQRSSLVWVEPTEKANALMALDDKAFLQGLDVQVSPWLGHVSHVSVRRSYPLSGVLAKSLTAPRTVLIGEAAHALSPIGAQGLNLSLQDVSLLGDLIDQAIATKRDLGSATLLDAYRQKRMPDIRARYLAVDGLNRMVASDWRLVGLARATGLQALGKLPFIRRRLMHAMMTPLELPSALARMAA